MLLSMTGFGKSVVELPSKKIIVEIKSLNSKQLDLSVRVPSALRDKEMELRNTVARKALRGKVEMNVYLESIAGDTAVQFNIPLMEAYKKQIENMATSLNINLPADWYSVLFRFPDVTKSDTTTATDAAELEACVTATSQALDALIDYRATEGAKLEEFFTVRIANIRNLLAQIPGYEVERVEKIRSRIIDNLSQLPQVEYDRARLEQEMIFYIEKLDISEEKQRLSQHLTYFMETLACEPGQGKKLGFISQEMGREINTLGSKSNHAEMQKIVVKMKDELEQIKEQVLNVL